MLPDLIYLVLDDPFSKCASWTIWVPQTLSLVHEIKTIFTWHSVIIWLLLFSFFKPVLIFALMVQRQQWVKLQPYLHKSRQWQQTKPFFITTHFFKSTLPLKNALDEAIQIINLFKCRNLCEIVRCLSGAWWSSQGRALCKIVCIASYWPFFPPNPMKYIFSLKNDWQTTMVIQTWVFCRHFLKNECKSLALARKRLTGMVYRW